MRIFTAIVVVFAVLAAACSVEPGVTTVDAPDGSATAFGPVADYLDHRCGTLDCHGQTARNLQIWSCDGMRLNPGDVPGCAKSPTTAAEHSATYRSLVGLEPEVMSTVVRDHGGDPELLTFVRKARGTETHKGGQLITPGDVQDTCIVSWLAGDTLVSACQQALAYPIFQPREGGAETKSTDASTE
jgi:hypothetical protein